MTTDQTYFDAYRNTPAEDIERLLKVTQLAELRQRVDLQRDMGIASRIRAQATIKREQAAADVAFIQADIASRQDAATRANDVYFKRYYFADGVGPESVQHCMAMMTIWHRQEANCAIEIVFTCPGGDIVQGFALFDFIRQMSRKGHKITTSVLGGAFSMAAMLLQAGDHRTMGKEAWLMFHAGEIGTHGTAGQVQDMAEWSKLMGLQMVTAIYDRAAAVGSDLTVDFLSQKIIKERSDWFVDSATALKLKLVDEIQ